MTVEEHSIIGGLGSAVAERLACCSHHPRLVKIGREGHYPLAGAYADLIRQSGLDAESIHRRILQCLKEEE